MALKSDLEINLLSKAAICIGLTFISIVVMKL